MKKSNVVPLKPSRVHLPSPVHECLAKLHDRKHLVRGLAFVCILDGSYIADTCGVASEEPDQTRLLLKALDAKIAKRQLKDRR